MGYGLALGLRVNREFSRWGIFGLESRGTEGVGSEKRRISTSAALRVKSKVYQPYFFNLVLTF